MFHIIFRGKFNQIYSWVGGSRVHPAEGEADNTVTNDRSSYLSQIKDISNTQFGETFDIF